MTVEGQLTIALSTGSGRVGKVCIESSRPVHASRVFHGKRVAETLKLLPMLFTICGSAQARAGVQACEQALGVESTPQMERLRNCLVRLETLREHLWRILLDWPVLLHETPEKRRMTESMAALSDYREAVAGGEEPFLHPGDRRSPQPVLSKEPVERILSVLDRTVFGMSPENWLGIHDQEALQEWTASGATVAARLIGRVMDDGWSGAGACDVEPLPQMDAERVHEKLQDDDFVLHPQWLGSCRETTCLTRVSSPLMQELGARYGNGLLARLAARLTELAQLSGRLPPSACDGGGDVPVGMHNPGIGQVAAARGQLLHRVSLAGDIVSGYQILAPTEWNFHPRGVVARSLATLCGDAGKIEKQANLLINAIDPCVAYRLKFA